jgi:soluble lytic murein transglycosylase-like protein
MGLNVFTTFLVGTFLGFLIFNVGLKSTLEPQVLGEKVAAASPEVTATPSPTETPVTTPSPTPSPTKKPTPKPTPTPLPQPKFTPQEINGFIDRFASQYGVSPDELRYIAHCESRFNAFARNGAYLGLFQFDPVTWATYRRGIGEDASPELRANAEEAVQTAAYALSLGKRHIWPNCIP